jgi:hypothetical protein
MFSIPYLDVKMKKASYILFLLVITAVVGCKKVELDPDSPSTSPAPVFTADVLVNGDAHLIAVGDNATLSTYHNTLGLSPYLGTTYTDVSGNDLLSFEFGFLMPFDQSSFSQSVEFGSLECDDYVLDIFNVQTYAPISYYTWSVNGEIFVNTDAHLTSYGEYDITLSATLLDGAQIFLRDRVILGGVETFEPEIVATEVAPGDFLFSPLNYTSEIDSIHWELFTESFPPVASNDVNFQISIPSPTEKFSVVCYYFVDGEVNYSSAMYSNSPFPAAPIADFGFCIDYIENLALPLTTKGKVTYNYNGDSYSTKGGQASAFQMSNVQQFMDEYSLETYLKGAMEFSSYLYNTSGDSIYVEITSDIGFSDTPQ